MTIDIPYGWTPQPHTNIDPSLECDLKDIQDDEPTRLEFIELITEKLKTVFDPEISIDIYNLGLIYDVKVTKTQHVFVLMSLTSAFCPAADTIPIDVQQKVESIPGLKCKVRITMQPQWGRDMINPEMRDLMGL
jgi:metal-sulfur cluster biosynthetic enzyme